MPFRHYVLTLLCCALLGAYARSEESVTILDGSLLQVIRKQDVSYEVTLDELPVYYGSAGDKVVIVGATKATAIDLEARACSDPILHGVFCPRMMRGPSDQVVVGRNGLTAYFVGLQRHGKGPDNVANKWVLVEYEPSNKRVRSINLPFPTSGSARPVALNAAVGVQLPSTIPSEPGTVEALIPGGVLRPIASDPVVSPGQYLFHGKVGLLYLAADRGVFHVADGQLQATEAPEQAKLKINFDPIYASIADISGDPCLILLGRTGNVTNVLAARLTDWRKVWEEDLRFKVVSAFATASGRLLLVNGDERTVVSYDGGRTPMTILYKFPAEGRLFGRVAIIRGE